MICSSFGYLLSGPISFHCICPSVPFCMFTIHCSLAGLSLPCLSFSWLCFCFPVLVSLSHLSLSGCFSFLLSSSGFYFSSVAIFHLCLPVFLSVSVSPFSFVSCMSVSAGVTRFISFALTITIRHVNQSSSIVILYILEFDEAE